VFFSSSFGQESSESETQIPELEHQTQPLFDANVPTQSSQLVLRSQLDELLAKSSCCSSCDMKKDMFVQQEMMISAVVGV
jgi:hypothetical protein